MKRVITFIVFILVSVNSFAESDIENRFNEYIVAFVGQDIEAVKAFLSPNGFVMNGYVGKTETKEEWLSVLEARNETYRKENGSLNITIDTKTISVTGNSAKIVGVYTWKIHSIENNKPKIQEAKINFMQTWERINNNWFLTGITNTKIPEPNKSLKDAP